MTLHYKFTQFYGWWNILYTCWRISLGFGMRLLLSYSSPFFFSCQQSAFFFIFTMASKFDSSLELSHFDQAILRIVWRNEKGHIDNTWRHVFFYKKGHGAAPFYFSLDKTLGQLEPNLAGMFLGWSSTNFRFFVPI